MTAWLELAVVVGLILLNAFFAMAELAVVSSRRIRLQRMAERGGRSAEIALAMAQNPARLLSSVQVGITLIGILAGAFGGATLGARLGDYLDLSFTAIAPYGHRVALAIVVVAITVISIVVGEVVPKRIALAQPERIALWVARPLNAFSVIIRPAVWLLERSSTAILALLGVRSGAGQRVTEEEVKLAIAEGTEAGVIDETEERMIRGVLGLADRPVTAVMTPRPDIFWIDLDDPRETLAREIADCPYSRIVVARAGDLSNPLGVVQMKELLNEFLAGHELSIEPLISRPIYVPESISVLRLLERFRAVPHHVAFVVDEYGDCVGLVTLTDVLEAIAGELPKEPGQTTEEIVRRTDGSWLVDGRVPIDEVIDRIGLRLDQGRQFHTAAGLALDRLARIPAEGDAFEIDTWRVEVIDMDGNRVDKLLFVPRLPIQPADAPTAQG